MCLHLMGIKARCVCSLRSLRPTTSPSPTTTSTISRHWNNCSNRSIYYSSPSPSSSSSSSSSYHVSSSHARRYTPRDTSPSTQSISIPAFAMGLKTDITLYTSATPNGIKVSILLEELGLEYKVKYISLSDNEQKEDWYLAINPNGRIPALTDTLEDGTPVSIFESGAIMQYLVDRYDTEHKVSYPSNSKEHWEVTSWLHWQMGGLGPMQGQSNHFKRYAPEKIPYGIERYGNEVRRLYRVFEINLASRKAQGSHFIVGDRVTIADIASWSWIASHTWAGIPLDSFPNVNAWLLELLKRPAFEKGRHVPKYHTAFDNDSLTEEQLDAKAEAAAGWVRQTMLDAAREANGKM